MNNGSPLKNDSRFPVKLLTDADLRKNLAKWFGEEVFPSIIMSSDSFEVLPETITSVCEYCHTK
jgi:hypothetical protein